MLGSELGHSSYLSSRARFPVAKDTVTSLEMKNTVAAYSQDQIWRGAEDSYFNANETCFPRLFPPISKRMK